MLLLQLHIQRVETATTNGCFNADKETAIYWYETALDADPNNAEAKARLQELKIRDTLNYFLRHCW